jgi:hypothetical protein
MSPEAKAWGFDSAGRRSAVSSAVGLCLFGGWLVGTLSLLYMLNLEIIVFLSSLLVLQLDGYTS